LVLLTAAPLTPAKRDKNNSSEEQAEHHIFGGADWMRFVAGGNNQPNDA
jgi:hypothetical protein